MSGTDHLLAWCSRATFLVLFLTSVNGTSVIINFIWTVLGENIQSVLPETRYYMYIDRVCVCVCVRACARVRVRVCVCVCVRGASSVIQAWMQG